MTQRFPLSDLNISLLFDKVRIDVEWKLSLICDIFFEKKKTVIDDNGLMPYQVETPSTIIES